MKSRWRPFWRAAPWLRAAGESRDSERTTSEWLDQRETARIWFHIVTFHRRRWRNHQSAVIKGSSQMSRRLPPKIQHWVIDVINHVDDGHIKHSVWCVKHSSVSQPDVWIPWNPWKFLDGGGKRGRRRSFFFFLLISCSTRIPTCLTEATEVNVTPELPELGWW